MTVNNPLTREEWTRRYGAFVMAATGLTSIEVIAKAGADAFEDNERAAKRAVVWTDPEGYADEELSYWGNDE